MAAELQKPSWEEEYKERHTLLLNRLEMLRSTNAATDRKARMLLLNRLEMLRSASLKDDGVKVPLSEVRRTHSRVVSRIGKYRRKQSVYENNEEIEVTLGFSDESDSGVQDKIDFEEQVLEVHEELPPEDIAEIPATDAGLALEQEAVLIPEAASESELIAEVEPEIVFEVGATFMPETEAASELELSAEVRSDADSDKINSPEALSDISAPEAPAVEKAPRQTPEKKARARAAMPHIKYPIKFKLVAIVSVLLLVSLGTVTALVSVLVSSDVQLTAEVNNFSINRRNAESMNNELRNIRSAVASFLNTVAIIDLHSMMTADDLTGFFFQHNPIISAVVLVPPEGEMRYIMPASQTLPVSTISSWLSGEQEIVQRSRAGETILRNVSPVFGTPQLAMLLPVTITVNTNMPSNYCAAVFFSQEDLDDILGNSANISFLINDNAEVLMHPEKSFVMGAANFGKIPFIENALSSAARGTQTIYVDETGIEYFGVYQRLSIGNSVLITIIKRSDVFAGIIATTQRNIVISIFVLILSIIIISIFASTIGRPLRALTTAAQHIENGHYQLDLTHKSHDEIGVLTRSFIGMGLGLENFEKFTNKAVVELARLGKLYRGGINKNITVCFVLIRDFSELSHNMSAQQIVSFVNEYLELMVPCVTKTGGIVDKFLTQGGVVIMAVWGSTGSDTTPRQNALNCIRSMLMMRSNLVVFNDRLQHRFWGYAPRIKIGCGINSGNVVAGQMGSEQRMEYTVIGDTVNLAARLEGANDVFDTDMLISEATWNLVKDKTTVKEMPNLSVKGKIAPLRVFSVVEMPLDDNEQETPVVEDNVLADVSYNAD
ncbi:MAG: HAMP domain-containing protein [Spirochaetaceae bacterium]|nr:HAMP domain-containing protein [Spirochaetaceae bacterium]